MNNPDPTTGIEIRIEIDEHDAQISLRAGELTVSLDKANGRICVARAGGATLCQAEAPSFRRTDGAAWASLTGFTAWRREGEAVALTAGLNGATNEVVRVHIAFPHAGRCDITLAADTARFDRARLAFAGDSDEHFFGGGERFSRVDQRGLVIDGWTDDQPPITQKPGHPWSHWPVPFFISTRGYGLFLDTAYRSTFDLYAAADDCYTVEVQEPALSYSLYWGDHPLQIIDLFTAATGRPIMVPPWNNGVWITCLGGQEAVLQQARRLRDEHVPCSALWVYDAYDPQGNIGLPINPKHNLGDYSDVRGLVAELHRLGYKVQTYVFPYYYVGTPLYAEAAEKGYFLKNPDGTTYQWPFYSATGPKPASIVDFTNPDATAWWQEQLRYVLVDLGFDGWMHDFSEQVPEHVVAYDGRTGRALHNAYPVLCQAAAREACRRWKPDASFYARAGYTGAQQWATAAWTGDQVCTWGVDEGLRSAVAACLSLSLSGMPYIGPDIGGYFGENVEKEADSFSTELWIRWAQFGALCSIMRDHLGHKPPGSAEMWTDEATLAAFIQAGRLHMSLSPYWLSCAQEATRTGAPIMRHMFLEEPHNPDAWRDDTQYLLGDALLAAPVVEEGARTRQVRFPPGQWIGFWDGAVQAGGVARSVPAPLETPPLYVRCGALLPTLPGAPDTLAPVDDPQVKAAGDDLALTLYVPPNWSAASPATGQARRELADGTELVWTWSPREVTVACRGPAARLYHVAIYCAQAPQAVTLDGAPLALDAAGVGSARYDAAAQRLTLEFRAASAQLSVQAYPL